MKTRLALLLSAAGLLAAQSAGATVSGALQYAEKAQRSAEPSIQVAAAEDRKTTRVRKKSKKATIGQERWLNPQPEPPSPFQDPTWLNPQPEPPFPSQRTPAKRPRATTPQY